MTLELTPAQFQTLAGLLDVAIKSLGIRAMEDDVVDLMQAVKAAAQAQPQPMDEAA
jgi:hypothetical protein